MAEYRVFGPVQLVAANRAMDLGPPKQRLVFAALVVDAGRPVTLGTLIDRVWGDNPPVEARNALYAHIMRLRRVLSAVARAEDTAAGLVRGPAGYALDIDPVQVDLHQVRHLVWQSRRDDCSDGERVSLLRRAMGLWDGAPLTDLAGPWVNRLREGLRQEHIDIVVAWARAELRTGNHGPVLARAGSLLQEYPTVEPLIAMMMRALAAAGRVAEALACFAAVRRRLADELGVEPTAELRELHRLLVRGDLGRAAVAPWREAADRPACPADRPRPIRQLPPDLVDFTGRSAPARRIVELLAGGASTAVPVVVLSGLPGVGKSALALHVAHQVREHFQDGQLFVALAGASGRPRDAADVLGDLLRTLGVAPGLIPDGLDQRAALWRATLAGRRILVVADDAGGPAQIRPLRPGTAGSAVLVTSRSRLAGLDAATLIEVDCLSPDDALQMLGRIAGGPRMTEERPAAEDLVMACGRLPLAIRIAGSRLAARPSWPVEHLARLISDERHRLDELTVDDVAVRSSIALSYEALDRRARRLFRRLALLGPHDFAEWVAGPLLGEQDARGLVTLLADKSLITSTGMDATGEPRYRLHDLLREYAAERLDDEAVSGPDAAVTRLLSAYLELSDQADRRVPRERYVPLPEPFVASGTIPADLAARLTKDPVAWFDAERLPLLAATARACALGRLTTAARLAEYQFAIQDMQARYDDVDRQWRMILDAADLAGELRIAAGARMHLGMTAGFNGCSTDALTRLDQAVAGYRQLDDVLNLAYCLAARAHWANALGRFAQARQNATEGLALGRLAGEVPAQILNLQSLGSALAHLGRPEDSRRHCLEAVELTRRRGNLPDSYRPIAHLAAVTLAAGDIFSAMQHARAALESAAQAEHPFGVAMSTMVLTEAYHALGRHQDTIDALVPMLPVVDRFRSRDGRAKILVKLGRAHQALGNIHRATSYLTEGAEIFDELGLDSWRERAAALLARTSPAAEPTSGP